MVSFRILLVLFLYASQAYFLSIPLRGYGNHHTRAPEGIHSADGAGLTDTIYPRKGSKDVDYSVEEMTLRSSIFFPPEFEYGAKGKIPVLLVPGTAISANSTFPNTIAKLLQQTTYADPVWINIPGNSLGDIQVNSEYVAYAINYISSVCQNQNISIVSWSQGGINVQWSFKYWPSTREVVSDFIALSPDFKGTVLAPLLCSGLTPDLCVPSVLQQESTSRFISNFAAISARNAYVPTTTVYSSTDEIVQPQNGDGASGYIEDGRAVGVTNNQVQALCPGTIQIVLHEGILYNAVAWALIQDAITHPGAGQSGRLNLQDLCRQPYAAGLSITDVLRADSLLVEALASVLVYTPKTKTEPAIASYSLGI